jgi:hypothetical protein
VEDAPEGAPATAAAAPPPPPPPPTAGAAAAALEDACGELSACAEASWRGLCGALLELGATCASPLQRACRRAAGQWARAALPAAPPQRLPLRALYSAPLPAALGGEGAAPPPRPPQLPRARCLDAAAECAPLALRGAAAEYGGEGARGAPPPPPPPPPPPGTHLVVFVNGLGGGKADTRCLRAPLKLHRPRLLCVAVDACAGAKGEGDILGVGLRLAEEVAALCAEEALAAEGAPPLARLSFVCFSLGGVWARVALRAPPLAPHRARLHAFVTLATPHLGFPPASQRHALVSVGAFFTGLAGRLPVLQQLAHGDRGRDGGEPSLLELLATGWGEGGGGGGANARRLAEAGLLGLPNGALLAHFRHVVLTASPQDAYSPLHSALAAAPEGGEGGKAGALAEAFWGVGGVGGGGAQSQPAPPPSDAWRVARVCVHFSEWAGGGAPWASRAEAAGLLPPPGDAGSAPPPPPPTSLTAAAAALGTSVFNSVSGRGAHLSFCSSEELGALLALAPPFSQCWE